MSQLVGCFTSHRQSLPPRVYCSFNAIENQLTHAAIKRRHIYSNNNNNHHRFTAVIQVNLR